MVHSHAEPGVRSGSIAIEPQTFAIDAGEVERREVPVGVLRVIRLSDCFL
jgi:hypothetical protein